MRSDIFSKLSASIKPIFLIFTFSFIVGCGASTKKAVADFTLDNVRYVVQDGSVAYSVTNNNTLDSSGGGYFLIDLQVTNHSAESIRIDSSNFRLSNAIGKVFPLSKSGEDFMGNFKEIVYKTEFAPQLPKDCILTYAVPGNDKYKLHVTSPKTGVTKTIVF